jgi:cytochrome c-type biogenesis protein CcmF
MNEGESITWEGRTINYVQLVQREEPDKYVAEVELRVSNNGSTPYPLWPARHFDRVQKEWSSIVAIQSTWSGDVYTILDAGLGNGAVALTFVLNPLMRWIWFGAFICGGGALLVIVSILPWRIARSQTDVGDSQKESTLNSQIAPRRLAA